MEGKALVVLELSASGSKRLPVSLYGSSIGAVNLLFDSFSSCSIVETRK